MKTLFTTALAALALQSGIVNAEAPVAGSELEQVAVIKSVTHGYRASKIIGLKIKNEKGDTLGKVDDLIISSDDHVGYAILSVSGFLGIGKKRVAVPVQMIEDIHGTAMLPGVTRSTLKKLPEFQYAD